MRCIASDLPILQLIIRDVKVFCNNDHNHHQEDYKESYKEVVPGTRIKSFLRRIIRNLEGSRPPDVNWFRSYHTGTTSTGRTNLTLLLQPVKVVALFMKDCNCNFSSSTFPRTLPLHINIQRRRIFVYFDSVVS